MEHHLGRRISIVGTPGSGKTTLAGALAEALGLRHIELDGVFHQPGWAHLSTGAFRHAVRQRLGAGDWITDGNYKSLIGDVVWTSADTVIWLDYPLRVAFGRVVGRTIRRARTKEPICNGNTESWANLWRREGMIRWALSHHSVYRRSYEAAIAEPAWSHLRFVRLTSPADADALLASLRQAVPRG